MQERWSGEILGHQASEGLPAKGALNPSPGTCHLNYACSLESTADWLMKSTLQNYPLALAGPTGAVRSPSP